MAKTRFNARDCTPLATCLEKHGLCVFPYVRKGVHERALHQRAELVLCVAPHNECAMHVHNHPQVVAHDVKHEYIRVCCVLWGFPYTETIIQPVLPTYTFPYTDAITQPIYPT